MIKRQVYAAVQLQKRLWMIQLQQSMPGSQFQVIVQSVSTAIEAVADPAQLQGVQAVQVTSLSAANAAAAPAGPVPHCAQTWKECFRCSGNAC